MYWHVSVYDRWHVRRYQYGIEAPTIADACRMHGVSIPRAQLKHIQGGGHPYGYGWSTHLRRIEIAEIEAGTYKLLPRQGEESGYVRHRVC